MPGAIAEKTRWLFRRYSLTWKTMLFLQQQGFCRNAGPRQARQWVRSFEGMGPIWFLTCFSQSGSLALDQPFIPYLFKPRADLNHSLMIFQQVSDVFIDIIQFCARVPDALAGKRSINGVAGPRKVARCRAQCAQWVFLPSIPVTGCRRSARPPCSWSI